MGVVCLAASLFGYLIAAATLWQRALLAAAAIALIQPGLTTDTAGGAAIAIVLAAQYLARRKLSDAPLV